MKEKELQNFIWENKNLWKRWLGKIEDNFEVETTDSELKEYFSNEEFESSKINGLTMEEVIHSMLSKHFLKCLDILWSIEIVSPETKLGVGERQIRADFLGLTEGRNGLVIIELKNQNKSEREAFTELLAYGHEIEKIFPLMNKEDLFYILIAPMNERITQNAYIHSLFFEKKNIVALIPTIQSDKLVSLKPWIPPKGNLLNEIFNPKNFELTKISWEIIDEDWYADPPDEYHRERMNQISALTSQVMEEKGINGFVYASQAYSSFLNVGATLLNSLVVVAINPYSAQISNSTKKTIQDFIPNIKKYVDENPRISDMLSFLTIAHSNILHEIGENVVKIVTQNTINKKIEIDSMSFSWDEYSANLIESGLCYNYKIYPTGIIRECYWEFTKLDYDYISKFCYENHIHYQHGDFPNYVIDVLNSQANFQIFLNRIFDPWQSRDVIG